MLADINHHIFNNLMKEHCVHLVAVSEYSVRLHFVVALLLSPHGPPPKLVRDYSVLRPVLSERRTIFESG